MAGGAEEVALSNPRGQVRDCTMTDSTRPHSGHSGKGAVPSVGHYWQVAKTAESRTGNLSSSLLQRAERKEGHGEERAY